MEEPKTLQEAILYFADRDRCIAYLAASRWMDGIAVCPTCGRTDVSYVPKRRVWQCKSRHPKCQFSIKVGTVFEDSPIPLGKWLAAMWMIANCKNGISSWEIHRALKVTQKTAWFMLHRLRVTMQDPYIGATMTGEVEADETFIGGKARNMHASRRELRAIAENRGKALVMGVLERGGKIKTAVVPNLSRPVLQSEVRKHVKAGAALYTDKMRSYIGLSPDYGHEIVDHAIEYVRGRVHTNGLENFWSLLKRGLNGTYVSVEPFHLFRYLDEQTFRFNNRVTKDNPLNDADRFALTVNQILGKRLTYKELTGKTAANEGDARQDEPF
jgi:transposase-like protein